MCVFSFVDKQKVIDIIITSFVSEGYVNSNSHRIEGPMENCRKSTFFLFLMVILMAFSVSSYAQTADEANNVIAEESTINESSPEPARVKPVVPVQPLPVKPEAPKSNMPDSKTVVGSVPQTIPLAVGAPVASESAQKGTKPTEPNGITKPTVGIPVPSAPQTQPPKPIVLPAVPQTSAQPAVKPLAVPAVTQTQAKPEVTAVSPAVPKLPEISQKVPAKDIPVIAKPSGIIELSGFKYPVFLYAPNDYKTDRTYPLIVMAPSEAITAQDQIEYLTGLAQRRGVFIMAPYVLWPKPGLTPYTLDKWILSTKKDVVDHFPINKKRIYLIGKDSGAHYAAYLAIKYPQEFAAVALLGKAWQGQFEQLVEPRSGVENQVPFYIALKAGGGEKTRNQSWFNKLQAKNYPIYLMEYQKDDELNELDFKKTVFEWLEERSQTWAVVVAKSRQTWKGKFKKGVKDFFAV